jgi:hypothetical protein
MNKDNIDRLLSELQESRSELIRDVARHLQRRQQRFALFIRIYFICLFVFAAILWLSVPYWLLAR